MLFGKVKSFAKCDKILISTGMKIIFSHKRISSNKVIEISSKVIENVCSNLDAEVQQRNGGSKGSEAMILIVGDLIKTEFSKY